MIKQYVGWTVPLLAVGVCALWVWVAYIRTPAEDAIFIDWTTYALGTERLLRGESLYLDLQLKSAYSLPAITPDGYIYPPSSALLFLPFAVAPPVGLVAWLFLNLGLLLAGIAGILRREFGAVRPFPLAYAILGLNAVIPLPEGVMVPFTNAVLTANVNIGLAGLLALCWAAGPRARWIPFAAAIGATFKMFPAALALWEFRRHGWRALLVAAGATGLIVLATVPIAGVDEWTRFAQALVNAEPTCSGGRTSVACLAEPVVGTAAAKLAGVVIGGTLLLAAVVVRRELPAFFLLTLGMLAPMADGHQHYLLFVYVLILVVVSRAVARRADVRKTGLGLAGDAR